MNNKIYQKYKYSDESIFKYFRTNEYILNYIN